MHSARPVLEIGRSYGQEHDFEHLEALMKNLQSMDTCLLALCLPANSEPGSQLIGFALLAGRPV